MDKTKTANGYNPLKKNRTKSFNTQKSWTETVTPITDEQKAESGRKLDALIQKIREQLNNEND